MITVLSPKLFNKLAIVDLCPKYIHSERSGESFNCILSGKRSKISFGRNPDRNFFISVVAVNSGYQLEARFSKSPPGCNNSSLAHEWKCLSLTSDLWHLLSVVHHEAMECHSSQATPLQISPPHIL